MLVTGGGTGIGRAIAREFGRSGAKVVICGRRTEPLEQVREELEAQRVECLAQSVDIREPAQVEALVAAAIGRFGAIDVLVNNAGGSDLVAAEDISVEEWQAVTRLNLDATWSVTRAVAVESMIPNRRGLIVFNGFSPLRGQRCFAHSAAARAGVANLASGLALEWSQYGIRSVCVALGMFHSEAIVKYDSDYARSFERAIPIGRQGLPEEVASVVAFLASAGGAYITGTTITIDGGMDAWGWAEPPPAPAARG